MIRPRILPHENPRLGALRLLLVGAGIALAGCHPGNTEAKRLTRACDNGDAAACSGLGQKLLKGEYILRDPPELPAC